MGFLGEIRKLLFGVKSVSKSGAEKAVNAGKELGEDILDKGAQAYQKGKDIAEDVVDAAGDKLSTLKNKAKDMVADISDKVSENPKVEKAADFTENVGKKVMDTGSKAAEKAGDFTEKVGKKVMEVGGEAMEKAGDISEKVGEKVMEAKDKLMEKAREMSGKINEKFDETYEKAKALEAEEALEGDSEYADTPIDIDKSLLEDSDDFFAKAAKYADGDYKGTRDKTKVQDELVDKTGDITIGDTVISLPEGDTPKKELAKAAGFEDLDGDGNEVVDDAILVLDELEEVVEDKVDDATDAAKDIKDEVVDAVSETVEKAEDTIQDKKEDVKDLASQALDHLSEDAKDKLDEMDDMMDKA